LTKVSSSGFATGRSLLFKAARAIYRALPLPLERKRRLNYWLRMHIGSRTGSSAPRRGGAPADAPPRISALNIVLLLRGPRRMANRPGELPDISIVIPIFNQIEFTVVCLARLAALKSRYSFETIVVDDCSSDATRDVLAGLGWVTCIHRTEQGGFVRACNDGIQQARGQYTVFLNNDTEVEEGWLDEMRSTFDARPDAGMIGSMLLYPDGALQEAGGIVSADGSAANFGRNDDAGKPEYNYLRPVDYVSAASIMISSDLLRRLGGFDPEFAPAYYEDVDLAFRVRRAGKSVLYQPMSRVIHHEGVSSGLDTASGVKKYQLINQVKFLARWRDILRSMPASAGPRTRESGHKLLVVDALVPTPDQDAGSNFCLELMLAAQRLDYQVTFIADNLMAPPGYTQALQRLGVEVIYQPYCLSVGEHLKWAGALYEVIVIHRVDLARAHLGAIKQYAPTARLVFAPVDLHHLRLVRQARVEDDESLSREALQTKSHELAVVEATDCTLVYSEYEREYLQSGSPEKQIEVLGWTNRCEFVRRRPEARADLIFIGGYRHIPNVDAVEYFLREIWPTVESRLRHVRLMIVGNEAPDRWNALATDRVKIVGQAPSLDPLLDSARVCIAPLRFGAGFKGKIATALSHGVPVVTTSIGAEGMGLQHGINVLIGDDPPSFTQLVLDLFSDDELWIRLSAAGMAFAEMNYSPEKALQVVRRTLKPGHGRGAGIGNSEISTGGRMVLDDIPE
jgi:GT2 family glycosyltransferase